MTVLIPRQPVTLKGSSECLCSRLALVTLVPLNNSLDQPSTQAGALPLPSNSFTVRWHSGHQAEPQHASILSLEATGGHCDSGALNLSDVGAID